MMTARAAAPSFTIFPTPPRPDTLAGLSLPLPGDNMRGVAPGALLVRVAAASAYLALRVDISQQNKGI